MDVIGLVQFIQKTTKERRRNVTEIIEQELSGLLKKQEQFDE